MVAAGVRSRRPLSLAPDLSQSTIDVENGRFVSLAVRFWQSGHSAIAGKRM
jgi:hypothetical protein